MGRSKSEIGQLGALGITREAIRILGTYSRALILIQLAVGLPWVLLSVALPYIHFLFQAPLDTLVPSDVEVSMAESLSEIITINRVPLLRNVMISLTEGLILKALQALVISANIHVVGLFYTGNSVSCADVLKVAVRRLWKRLVVTYLWLQMIELTALFSCAGVVFGIVHFELDPSWILIPVVLLVTVMIYIALISLVAAGASVLEEDYGRAAIRKARKLLGGKKWVAFRLFFLLAFLSSISACFLSWNVAVFVKDRWNPMPYLLTFPHIAFLTWLTQFTPSCVGVAYVSFKAHHGETLVGSSLVEDLGKEDNSELKEVLIR